MARATRSSVQLPPSPPNSLPPSSKKRKRLNSPTNDDDDQPPSKQHRTSPAPISSAGDRPIDSDKAQKILDILEMIDAQGLLDRVFPLSSDSASSSYSFRALLKDSSHHSLSVLRSVVQHLFPISSHPRARPSKPAAQQLKFCNLALSLLDQASVASVDASSDFQALFPDEAAPPDEETPQPSTSKCPASNSHLLQKPRYALVQHLPQGDYWTSLNSLTSSSELKDLPQGHSELVSILPSPYPTNSISDISTLGSYHTKSLPQHKHKVPTRRPISRGSFLDYGIWASFGPSFDQDGSEVGRAELGEVYFARELKKKQKETRLGKWIAERERQKQDDIGVDAAEVQEVKPLFDVDAELAELLPADQVKAIKDSLQSWELEQAVSELLGRTRKALERLQELQYLRLMADDGGLSSPEEGSEEWDTAQSILESLSVLASLRPRTSSDESAPLIPSPSILHALHRTLPLTPSSGWHGNLPPGRTIALRDDSTIKLRPGAPATAPTPATSSTPAVPTTYGTYQYAAYTPAQTSQGATTATTPYMMQYKLPAASGATSYYTSHYATQQMYGAQAYGTGVGTTAYGGGWYNSYTPQTNNAIAATSGGTSSGTGSARGTPQPNLAPSYSSFFSGTGGTLTTAAATNGSGNGRATPQAQGQLTPAVANTVMKPGQWGTLGGASTPTAAYAGQTLTIPLPVRGPSVTQMRTQWPPGQQNAYQPNGRSTPAAK